MNFKFTIVSYYTMLYYMHMSALPSVQAACAVHALQEMSDNGAFILAGDYNSTPDFAPYSLMAKGRFDHSLDHWKVKPRFDIYPWDGDETSEPNMSQSVPWQSVPVKPMVTFL